MAACSSSGCNKAIDQPAIAVAISNCHPELQEEPDKLDPYLDSLGKPPVPNVEATASRFVDYATVIARDEQQLEKTKKRMKDFLDGPAAEAQAKLKQIAQQQPNWVNLFWIPDMYLKTLRVPLPVNSNPAYIFPKRKFEDADDMIRYAAALIRGFYTYKSKIDNRTLPQDVSTGRQKVPLCMDQYWRVFGTYREPRIPADVQHNKTRASRNEHIIVMHNNQCFVVRTKMNGELLADTEIVYQMKDALTKAANRVTSCVIPVAAHTTAQRDTAAEILQRLKTESTNLKSLEWIRTSSLVVCFDHATDQFRKTIDLEKSMSAREFDLAHQALNILHGCAVNGLNRWYDKSMHLVFNSDGTTGMLIEHSCAEGMVFINLAEEALVTADELYKRRAIVQPTQRIAAKPLSWHVDSGTRQKLQQCSNEMQRLAKDLQFNVMIFDDFGREFAKANRISPDVFVQLGLQLAYYK